MDIYPPLLTPLCLFRCRLPNPNFSLFPFIKFSLSTRLSIHLHLLLSFSYTSFRLVPTLPLLSPFLSPFFRHHIHPRSSGSSLLSFLSSYHPIPSPALLSIEKLYFSIHSILSGYYSRKSRDTSMEVKVSEKRKVLGLTITSSTLPTEWTIHRKETAYYLSL